MYRQPDKGGKGSKGGAPPSDRGGGKGYGGSRGGSAPPGRDGGGPRPSDRGGYPDGNRGGYSSRDNGRSGPGSDRGAHGDRGADRAGQPRTDPGRGGYGDRPRGSDHRGGDRPVDRPPSDRDRDRDRGAPLDRRDPRDQRTGHPSDRGGDRPRPGGYPPDRGAPIGGRSNHAVPPPSTHAVPPPTGGSRPPLHVSGCSNETVSNIIAGLYITKEDNHGKPVYKKEGPSGSVTVLIYYWDDRDGSAFNGWWFGPKVGGDQVWAYNGGNLGSNNVMPPTSNWKVPWDGKIDEKVKLTFGGPSPGAVPSGMPPRGGGGGMREDEERRRREERERARLMEEKRRRDEDDERRQREEARRRQKAREEEQARKDAEERRRRNEEMRKREDAANNVRKVLDRIRTATPDNMKELQAELDRAAAENFQAMGDLRNRVNEEMQNILTQVQNRIAEEIKQREEEEKRRKAEISRCQLLLKEAVIEVDAADAKVAEAQASSKEATSQGQNPEVEPSAALEAVEAASKLLAVAKEHLERSEKTLKAKEELIGTGDGAKHVKREVKELYDRIHGGDRAIKGATGNLEETKSRGLRRAAAMKQSKEWKDCFARLDADGDGRLNRTEVSAFGLAEFGFELPEEVLNKIMRVLEPIGFDKFISLRQKVAIAKSEAESRKRRAEELELKKLAEEKSQEVGQTIDEIKKKVEEMEAHLTKAEEDLKALAKDDTSENITAGTEKAEAGAKEVQDMLVEASQKLQQVEEACDELPDLKRMVRRDVTSLQEQLKQTEAHMGKLSALVKASCEQASEKALEAAQKLKTQIVTALRSAMSSQGKDGQELFEGINGGQPLSLASLKDFFKGLDGFGESLLESQLENLFEEVAGSLEATIEKEPFLDLIRLYYKCVKGTVLSEDITIKSKTVRRLDHGEVLEVLAGPSKDDGANVERVRCLAVQDGATGWATIAGNQGTPFLVQGGNVYSSVGETPLSKGPAEEGEDAEEVRKLAPGEIFEVLEFQVKETAEGPRRGRGKAKLDGATGWVTIADKDGNVLLEQR
mmetsp:Transcript_104529/g.185972  ORF Transcript_104529/g.185972 Transcript_104529/m.185972 type:complete len:1039 (+) Transcript_104529:66-3182(+)